jgi:hypothetical protein
MIEKQSKSLAGQLSTLNDNVTLLSKAFGELLIPMLNEVVPKITTFVQELMKAIKMSSEYDKTLSTMEKVQKGVAISAKELENAITNLYEKLRFEESLGIFGMFAAQRAKNDIKYLMDKAILIKDVTKEKEKETKATNEQNKAIAAQIALVNTLFKGIGPKRITGMAAGTGHQGAAGLGTGVPSGIGQTGTAAGIGAQGPAEGTMPLFFGLSKRNLQGITPEIKKIDDAAAALSETLRTDLADSATLAFQGMSEALGTMIVDFAAGAESMKEVFKSFIVSMLRAMATAAMATGPLGWAAAAGLYAAAGVVQAMAQGGIVTKPTLALIGEKGPEAVVPLGQSAGMGIVINVQGSVITERELSYMVMRHMGRSMRGY